MRIWASNEPEIIRLWIFGSRAKGCHCEESDLDVAVEVGASEHASAEGIFPFRKRRWANDLCDLTGLEIDLWLVCDDDQIVLPAVLDHGLLVYEDTAP
ncbi:nucleotidyltransferase family protein [Maricaulaceae bacterium MS644]